MVRAPQLRTVGVRAAAFPAASRQHGLEAWDAVIFGASNGLSTNFSSDRGWSYSAPAREAGNDETDHKDLPMANERITRDVEASSSSWGGKRLGAGRRPGPWGGKPFRDA
jgi:hypothetical protein